MSVFIQALLMAVIGITVIDKVSQETTWTTVWKEYAR